MPETFAPAEFSPGFDAQSATRGDRSGLIPIIRPGGIRLAYADAAPEDTTYVDVVAAPGAGKKIRLYALVYANRHTLASLLRVRFGAGSALFPMGLAPTTGNFAVPFPAGSYIEGGENEALQTSLISGTAGAGSTKAIALYTIENA